MIQQYRQQISSGAVDFGALASTESHCSSAKRGGDLGPFGPGQMQKAFEDVSYSFPMLCSASIPPPVMAVWAAAYRKVLLLQGDMLATDGAVCT